MRADLVEVRRVFCGLSSSKSEGSSNCALSLSKGTQRGLWLPWRRMLV
jgi:hypothetical protein